MADEFFPSTQPPAERVTGGAMDRKVVVARGWKRWRWPAVAVLVVAGVVIAIRAVPSAGSLQVDAADISSGTASQALFDDYLPLQATVTPLHTVYLDAVAAGQVEQVQVLDGALVTQGQVLATLRNPDLQLEVSSNEADITGQLGQASAQRLALQQSLATEQAGIASAGYDVLKAQKDLSVRRALQSQGFESDAAVKTATQEADYDGMHAALLRAAYVRDQALAQTQLAAIADTEQRLRRNFDAVQSSLDALVVKAPIAGRLANFSLQPGQSVKNSDRIAQIDSAGQFRLDGDVDEYYLGRVAAGQRASASFDGAAANLQVSRALPQVNNGQFRIELTFTGTQPDGLHSGESADTRVTLGASIPSLVVPNGPWFTTSGGNYIFVLDADGKKATRRAITAGRRNPDAVEITSGLKPGERVITSDYAKYQNFSRLILN